MAGYSASSLIRFKAGLAQKYGGWSKFYAAAIGGVPRAMHAWQDLNEADHLAVGTTTTLGVITSDQLTDITPQTVTTNPAVVIDTINTSKTVTIHDASLAATPTTYDSVLFQTPISVGGIVLSGLYPIALVTASNIYQITAASAATSTVTSGGAVPTFTTASGSASVSVTLNNHGLAAGGSFVFPVSTTVGGLSIVGTYTVLSNPAPTTNTFSISANAVASSSAGPTSINSGNARFVYYVGLGPTSGSGSGYGTGTYGTGGFGTGVATTVLTGTKITSTDWSHDNWGSVLLSCPDGGGIYKWTPDAGFQNAQLVSGAPIFNRGAFVVAPAQILLCFGSTEQHEIGIDQDPLLYTWSDQLDYEFWTPGIINPSTGQISQAGSNRIPTGSKIVAGLQATQQALLWTDLDLWSINYIGAPDQGLIFGQTKIASSCGAIGTHAVGQLGNTVYWMGQSNFFALSGNGVVPLPCTVWDAVFQDLDTANAWKVRACPNTPFNEFMWQFPSLSGGTGENDTFVLVNIMDGSWTIGPLNSMPRSAWIDQSVLGGPIGASPAGIIYSQEDGEDADGQPMLWSFQTGYWTIGEGEDVAFVDMFVPDFIYGTYNGNQNAIVTITFYSVMYPGGPITTYPTKTVSQSTTFVTPRIRGRQMSIKVSGSDLGSFVRIGKPRYRWAPDGRF
jgi:hypothetical protein